MAKKRKAPKRKGRIVLTVILVLLCLAVIAFAGVGIWKLFDPNAPAAFTAEYNGKAYKESGRAFKAVSGEEFKLSKACTARITASPKGDFRYTVEETELTWKSVAGENFTKGFDVELTEKGFKLSFGTLEEVISKVYGKEAKLAAGANVEGVLFDLTFYIEEQEALRLGFGFEGDFETHIELDPDEIVFGG